MTRTAPSSKSLHTLRALDLPVEFVPGDADTGSISAVPVPVPVPNLPTLYNIPDGLYAVYRPVPAPVKAAIWVLAAIVAAWTTKGIHLLFLRFMVQQSSSNWKRKLLMFLLKTFVIASVSIFVVQDMFWGPSRVSVQDLLDKYWLPSTLSNYQPLQVTTDSNETLTLGVHYLEAKNPTIRPDQATYQVVYVNHGFGASILSWLPAMDHLAKQLNARLVVGHDATGFGFTDRPSSSNNKNLEMFTCQGSAKIGLSVLQQATKNNADIVGGSTLSNVILIGHSLGSITTLRMALAMDKSIHKHIILVSPALTRNSKRKSSIWSRILFPRALLDIPAAYILRRVIGAKNTWRRGLELAWGNPSTLSDSDVLRYQWPSIGKGWERGLLTFSRAQSLPRDLTDMELLEHVLQLPNTTVNVIISSKDKIVPPTTTREILKAFPSVKVVELDGLGHDPFEEREITFVECVKNVLDNEKSKDYC